MAGLSIYLGCLSILVGVAFGSTAAPDVMYQTLAGKGTYEQTKGDCKPFGEDFHIPKYNKDDQRIVRDAMKENVPEAWVSMARTRYPMWKWLDNVPVDHNFAQQDWKPHMNCGVLHLRDNVVEVDNCTYRDFGFVCELPGGKDCLSMGVQETNCRVVGKRTFVLFCSSQNWYDALYQCRQKGMELAVVKSGNIQADLSTNWYRQTKECSQVWIGLRREDWNYTSPDEKNIIQYHWAPGQPSQVGDCAVVYKKLPQDWYLWKSVECNSQQGRVCVRRIEPETTEEPDRPSTSVSPMVHNVNPSPGQGGSSNLGVAIGIPVLLLLLGVIGVVGFLVFRRRRNQEKQVEEGRDPAGKPLLNDHVADNISTTSSFESLNEPEVSSDPVEIGAEKIFDSSGGSLVIPDSDIALEIPNGAVPGEKKITIKARVHAELNVPSLNLPKADEETVISPLIDITSTGKFEKYVTLTIPCKKIRKEHQQAIKAYYRQNATTAWVKADSHLLGKKPGLFADVYFKLSQNAILIETKHFTQFICTCKSEARNIGLTGVLFAKYRDSGSDPMQQEVQLNVFVLEAVHSTRETLKALESEVAQNGTHQRVNMQIDLSEERLVFKDRLLIKLNTQEEWKYISEEEKEKTLYDIATCHKPQLWVLAAEFVLQRETPYKEALDGTRITLTFTVKRDSKNQAPKRTSYTHYIPFNKRQKRQRPKVKSPEPASPEVAPVTTPVTEEPKKKITEEGKAKPEDGAVGEKTKVVEDNVILPSTDDNQTKKPSPKDNRPPEEQAMGKDNQGAVPDEKNPFVNVDLDKNKTPSQEADLKNRTFETLGPSDGDPCTKTHETASVVEATEALNMEENFYKHEGASALSQEVAETTKLLQSEPAQEQDIKEGEIPEKPEDGDERMEQKQEVQQATPIDTVDAAEATSTKEETKSKKKGGFFKGKKK